MLKKILRPTSFKIGCLIIILSVLLFQTFGQNKPALLVSLDNQITDAMFRWRGPVPTTGQVVIVDIDEKSLKEFGQWPWPRDIVALLVTSIHESGVKVLGFDIVFAEKDRTSPIAYISRLGSVLKCPLSEEDLAALEDKDALNHDIILGNAVAAHPTVLGYVFQQKTDTLKTRSEKPFPSANIRIDPPEYSYENIALMKAFRAIVNVEDVAQAETEGFFNVFPDQSGTVRKVPLFMELDGLAYPSLALEMLRLGLQEDTVTIHLSKQEKTFKQDIIGVSFANRFIPTDATCQVTVNYRGTVFSFPYVSALDVIQGKNRAALKDKYVIIGTSAAGLLDLRATPFSSKFTGVEIHANVIDNILAGDLFLYDIFTENAITLTIIIVFGLILSFVLSFCGPVYGGIGGLLTLITLTVGNYYLFFLRNEIIGVAYPFVSFLLIFIILSLFNYFFEGREKHFIHKAFGHYVSPHVVNALVKRPDKLSLKGEQKELTIFFSDIRDFTTISESMNSHQLGILLNEYLTAMSTIVMEYEGMVDKFIGDAIMAIWGAPLDDENHARNAARASLKMMETLTKLQVHWESQGFPKIDIGIGVNTGMVSVGNFGSHARFDYTVIGDNVNLASRLEGLNKMYGTKIIISEFTKMAIGDSFSCRLIDLVKVKGKKESTKIFELVCEGSPDPEKKKEIVMFEEALSDYHSRKFKDAYNKLETLNHMYARTLYTGYLDRIDQYFENPPPEDWDGAFVFKRK
ncbi:MAG: adenylate/guanylate cyclase domain-containing protein [Proteobacteria bacterium]|nr:adenylate/guanylate cyclase domain-containing protein [Pseudomonadota bacterium]